MALHWSSFLGVVSFFEAALTLILGLGWLFSGGELPWLKPGAAAFMATGATLAVRALLWGA